MRFNRSRPPGSWGKKQRCIATTVKRMHAAVTAHIESIGCDGGGESVNAIREACVRLGDVAED